MPGPDSPGRGAGGEEEGWLGTLGLGAGLGVVAFAGGTEGLLNRFRVGAPVMTNGSFISPLTEVLGDVSIGRGSFVAGTTVITAQPGARA